MKCDEPCALVCVAADADDDDEDDDEKDDDPNVDMETSFSTRELLCIRNEIESVVKTLLHLLKSGSLQHRPQCVNECVRVSSLFPTAKCQ